jgi:hypothetical protein
MSGRGGAAVAVGVVLIAALVAFLTTRSPEPAAPSRATVATPEPTPEPTPRPPPGDPAIRTEAMTLLDAVVTREAGNPDNAWALAHGILARGRAFQATDGRLALRVLGDDFLESATLTDGSVIPAFPKARGDARVEPHTDQILKVLLQAGVPLDEPLGSETGGPTLRDLLHGSQARFAPVREEGKSLLPAPDDAPWSVAAWCLAAEASGRTEWIADGGAVTLEEIAAAQLGLLERETWFIRQAIAAGGTIQKKKQDIFAFTCGGAHLFGGAEACARTGWPQAGNTTARLETLVELYLFRLPLETALVDETVLKHPTMAPLLVNQDVKFLGHLLEALGQAAFDGLWEPDEQQRSLLDQAEARLLAQVVQLGAMRAYEAEAMAGLSQADESFQFYLDLVGDACHAWRGLELTAALREQ